MEKSPGSRTTTFLESIILFAIIVTVIGYTALGGKIPVGVGLLISLIVVFAYGVLILKFKWDDLFQSATDTVASVFYGLMFCLSVGMVSAMWLASGTIQFLLYWGLNLINPNMFLIIAFLTCAIASFVTGQAWTMIPTLGLAYIGIAQAIGVPLPIAAGAIVSGCFLGDAASPVCEVPAVASASVGSKDIMGTLKSMIPTLGTGYLIGAIFFLVVGLNIKTSGGDLSAMTGLKEALANGFNLSPLTLVPLVVVFVLIIIKVNPLASVVLGSIVGLLEGIFLQGIPMEDSLKMIWTGFVSNTGNAELDVLLTRGGLMDFAGTILMLLIAFCFAGVIKKIGLLHAIVNKILLIVKNPGTLMIASTLTTLIGVMVACAANVSSVITGSIYKDAYQEMGVHKENLAREMAMNGAVFSAMLPWTSSGALCVITLGVNSFDFWPYMIPFWVALILNIVFAFIGKFTRKCEKVKVEK